MVIKYWSAKRPGSVLSGCMPATVSFEIDYAEYLDEALAESDSYDLCTSLSHNTGLAPKDRQWWILKPALTARGDGIRLFSDESQLRESFESVEDDDDEISEDGKARFSNHALASGAVPHLVCDISSHSASEPYCPPWESMSRGSALTNTHLQGTVCSESARQDFWTLPDDLFGQDGSWKDRAYFRIQQIAGECFLAAWTLPDDLFGQDGSWKDRAYFRIQQIAGECFLAAATMNTNIALHPDCFEIFALDFLIDQDEHVWLMEVNSGPGLSAEGIGSRIAKGFFKATADVLLQSELSLRPRYSNEESMEKVLDVALPHQRFAPLKQV
ncbi:hypothetical protein FOPG_19284 [Fusarium oxysporum f. sp. conglutinans race 2 54008]|uniref:ATP-grasp domain-containing protein n=1 Tax=Fusarium oxysporum f. sp. conglutinans race 2 54008 TaxID=1089457 RepID=X0GLH7_FUSOX|nr:hypothetical protein FOPG_19284 [Fusarium oxysporum f. sp. conglutinans race 2 54008]